MTFLTVDGNIINGRIMNLNGDQYRINTDMTDPNAITMLKVGDVDDMRPSKVSMMPEDLLNTLTKDDVRTCWPTCWALETSRIRGLQSSL